MHGKVARPKITALSLDVSVGVLIVCTFQLSKITSLSFRATSPAAFFTALDAGELNACLDLLRRDDDPGADGAALNCRLAEVLFYHGRRDEALECSRRALAFAAGDDADTARFCAWLFSNCECHDEAALVYERLLALTPDWVEGHRHASGSLAASGALDRAIPHAVAASDLAPDHGEFALHAGCVLLDAGRPDEAVGFLRRALDADPEDNPALRALSTALLALDRQDDALAVALHAAALAPGDAVTAIHACELLMRGGRLDDAAAIIEPAATVGNATALRVLSGVEMARDRDRAALA